MKKYLLKSGLMGGLAISLLASPATAAVLYWDPEGTTAESAAVLAGTWSTAAQWATTYPQSASPVSWVAGDAACFSAGTTAVTTPFVVTLNSTFTIGGIFNGSLTPPGCFVTISGSGSLNLAAGADAFSAGGSDGGTTTIAVPLTGAGQVALEGSAQMFFNATNTYSGGTDLGYPGVASFSGVLNFNNGQAFGSGPIYMTSSGGGSALVVEGTLPVTVPNPVVTTNVSLNVVGNPAGLTFSGPWTLATTPNIGSGGSGNLVTIAGVMSGTGGFAKYNPSTLMLTATNTFTGGIVVSNGTLALGANGSFNNSSGLTLLPGANGTIFDVSAIPNYTNSIPLNARGTGTATAAAVRLSGAVGGTVTLGSAPLILTFTPAAFAGDLAHPSLWVSQGSLILNSNTVVVTNFAATALGAGSYRLVQVGDGNTGTISGSPNPAVTVLGKGLVTGATAWLMVTNGNLNLVVKPLALFSNLSLSQSNVFGLGAATVTLAGKVSAGSLYPAVGEGFGLSINGLSNSVAFTDATGDFSLTFNPVSIPYSATGYALAYSFPGDTSLSPAVFTTNLLPNVFFTNTTLPGFYGGLNLITTNLAGLNFYTWMSTNAGLPVTDWSLVGPMVEQALNDGSGKSRYTLNVVPAAPLVYYLSGTSLDWPYLSPTAVQWITTDVNGDYAYFVTNAAISATGFLSLPAAPAIVAASPGGQTVFAGQNVVFNLTVTGTQPVGYQWYFNTNTLVSTNASLVLNNVATNASGTYMVLVTNLYGSTTNVMILQVLPLPLLAAAFTPGQFQLSATGIPGSTYWVQSATNLTPPVVWQTLATNTASTNGMAAFTDTNVLANPELFYRLVFP